MALTQTRFRWRNDDGDQVTASWQAVEDVDIPVDPHANTRLRVQVSATGDPAPTAYTLYYRKTGDVTWRPVPVRKLADLTPMPPQSAAVVYGDDMTNVAAYAHPGGFLVAGRDNYDDAAFQSVSAGGGTVLIYIDCIIDNAFGRYHNYLLGRNHDGTHLSEWGEIVPRWPGDWVLNANPSWDPGNPAYLNDFRVGSILQAKLEGVLEMMVAENPHMAGFFLDDCGSRSYFPDLKWPPVAGIGAEFPFADKQAYREGAIEICRTARRVCDKYGLFMMVNGTWQGLTDPDTQTLEGIGGGYPDVTHYGCSFADGFYVEHHPADEVGFWHATCVDPQWASESGVLSGEAFHFAVCDTDAIRDVYRADGAFAFVNTQTGANYEHAPAPYSTLHATGLPHEVGETNAVIVATSPNIRNGGGGTTRQLTVP